MATLTLPPFLLFKEQKKKKEGQAPPPLQSVLFHINSTSTMALRNFMAKKYRSIIIVAQSLLIALLLCVLSVPHSTSRDNEPYTDVNHKLTRRDVQPSDAHPFENACNFPILEDEDPSLKSTITHNKEYPCPIIYRHQVVNRSMDGSFFINSFVTNFSFSCAVQVLSGSLRPHAGSAKMSESLKLPLDKHFSINEDAFVISCKDGKDDEKETFSRAFMDVVDMSTEPPSRLFDLASMSVAILVFDSTSRSQFARHMKKSRKLMSDMGFVTLLGYNKVGDNSAPNLSPIIASPYKENEDYDLLDETGDIALNKLLPSRKRIDPDTIDFIWKKMKNKGCETFFNDDVMHTSRGLFHYDERHFLNGFMMKPTDHYYRPVLHMLHNKWKLCWDGQFMSEEFIAPWFLTLTKLANQCLFSFNFLTSPSHDNPNTLESVDEILYERLRNLNESVTFYFQAKFAGRIEERQPLMSILLPKEFKSRYPTEYSHLLNNVHRLTSNLDIHETLLDVIDNRLGKSRSEGRGRSLFTPISTSRICMEAWIPKNFCLCQYKATGEERARYNQSSDALLSTLSDHLQAYTCLNVDSLNCSENHTLYQPHQSVRMGMRNKANWTVKMEQSVNPKGFFAQTRCEIKSTSDIPLTLLVRSRVDVQGLKHSITYSPMIVQAEGECAHTQNLGTFCASTNRN